MGCIASNRAAIEERVETEVLGWEKGVYFCGCVRWLGPGIIVRGRVWYAEGEGEQQEDDDWGSIIMGLPCRPSVGRLHAFISAKKNLLGLRIDLESDLR